MRGLTYQNVSGYSKLALMTSTPEDWRTFLTAVGTGHELDSQDLRVVPTQDLMAVLHPMLTDPELMFYLEYSGKVATAIHNEALKFNDKVPRQSSSYVVSYSAGDWVRISDLPAGDCTQRGYAACNVGAPAYVTSLADDAVAKWKEEAEHLKSWTYTVDNSSSRTVISVKSPTDKWKKYAGSLEEIQKLRNDLTRLIDDSIPLNSSLIGSLDSITQWPDPDGYTWDGIVSSIKNRYDTALSENATFLEAMSRASAETRAEVLQRKWTPDELYDDKNVYTTFVKQLKDFIFSYFKYLEENVKDNSGSTNSRYSVVVRFYPNAATITEPVPVVQTTGLSENSFIQTVSPAVNLSVVLQGNLAIDTPDTQWRELYANIFKIILSNGNPMCKARIGRYIVPNCYINAVSDFSNNHNTTPTFNFSLVSTEWDSAKLTPVNYVG